jgi:hypothetical protein
MDGRESSHRASAEQDTALARYKDALCRACMAIDLVAVDPDDAFALFDASVDAALEALQEAYWQEVLKR